MKAFTASTRLLGLAMVIAVRSHGFAGCTKSGITARSRAAVSALGCGIGAPASSALAAAMTQAPPDVDNWNAPGPEGRSGALAKNAAIGHRSSRFFTVTNPARSKAACTTSSAEAIAPVCDFAACLDRSPVAALHATITLPTSRARFPSACSFSPSLTPSNSNATVRVASSSSRKDTMSHTSRSAEFPAARRCENPIPLRGACKNTSRKAPDWDTIPTPPRNAGAWIALGENVASARLTLFTYPRQFGPITRMPVRSAISAIRACWRAPSSSISAKPEA